MGFRDGLGFRGEAPAPVAEISMTANGSPLPRCSPPHHRATGLARLQDRHLPGVSASAASRLSGSAVPTNVIVAVGIARRRVRPNGSADRPNRGESRSRCGGQPRRRRAIDADRARSRIIDRTHSLELRPALQPGRRAVRLPAGPASSAGWHQPSARPAVAPRRTREDAGSGGWKGRASRRHRPRLRAYLGPRAGFVPPTSKITMAHRESSPRSVLSIPGCVISLPISLYRCRLCRRQTARRPGENWRMDARDHQTKAFATILCASGFSPGHSDLHRIFANPKEPQPTEITRPFFDQALKLPKKGASGSCPISVEAS
jgi:hypothetical protein